MKPVGRVGLGVGGNGLLFVASGGIKLETMILYMASVTYYIKKDPYRPNVIVSLHLYRIYNIYKVDLGMVYDLGGDFRCERTSQYTPG